MGWLRDRFDVDHDPEGCERVTCEICSGSGMPRAGSGAIFAYDACAPLVYCRARDGKGYRLVKKDESASHDATSG